jgi:hypothetical protein
VKRLHVLLFVGPPANTGAFDRLTAAAAEHGFDFKGGMSNPLTDFGQSAALSTEQSEATPRGST